MKRLLNYFKPENYQLDLRINKLVELVQGREVLTGESKSDRIKLHAKDMDVHEVKLNGAAAHFTHENDEIEIVDVKPLDRQVLEISFSYKLKRDMEGAYLSTYTYNGHEERIVTTQFESHYAREAFPCVDEPAAKATFDLKITDTDPEDTILSNMPAKTERIVSYNSVDPDQDPKQGVGLTTEVRRKIVTFEQTPKMSTYLVAFICGRFNKLSTTNLHGVKITTYAALNHNKSVLKFPNEIAAESIDFYDDLFDIPYPLPKLDQVALPDFEAGAMENWGLVTYREACLLADKKSSQGTREYVATVIAHELSHQWFGDLVTMEWWNNLWLNESFANMMEYYCVDKLHPDWHVWQDYFTGDCIYALRRDALQGVQAVQQDVDNPEEISTLFDSAIVYAKGSHLMLMLMRLMGERSFFAGLRSYFKKHKYSNTTGDDLWAALHPHAKFDVKEFMDAWISQPGYPMITDGTQQRFLLNSATDDTTWPLPEVTDDMSGHYVICLSGPEFDEKLKNFDKLTLEQKIRLLADRQLLSKTSIVSSGSLMDLLPKFKDETSEPVWNIVADIANSLKIFCGPDTKYYPKYQKFIWDLVEPNLKRLGYEPKRGEDEEESKLRDILLGFAIYSRDEHTLKALSKIFDRDVKADSGSHDYSGIDPEIRSAVLDAKFRYTGEAVFNDYLEDYQHISDPSIKAALLCSLTDAEDPENTRKLIALLEQPEVVRPQDHVYLFAYLLSNFYTRERAFDWLYGHWDYIKSLTSDKSLDDYVRIAAARIRDFDQEKRFFEFFDKQAEIDTGIVRSVKVAHVDVSARLRWISEDQDAIRQRLDEMYKD